MSKKIITKEQIDKMFEKWFKKQFKYGNIETDDFTGPEIQDSFHAAINLLLPLIEKQNEALKFYGDSENYRRPDRDRNGMGGMSAQTDFEIEDGEWRLDSTGDKDHYCYGKLARSTQKEVEEYLKGVLQEGKI